MISKLKEKTPLGTWCREPFENFKDFATELESLQFEQKPNYSKLRNMIHAMIHELKQK